MYISRHIQVLMRQDRERKDRIMQHKRCHDCGVDSVPGKNYCKDCGEYRKGYTQAKHDLAKGVSLPRRMLNYMCTSWDVGYKAGLHDFSTYLKR